MSMKREQLGIWTVAAMCPDGAANVVAKRLGEAEYKVVPSARLIATPMSDGTAAQLQEKLNEFSRDGWELVAVYQECFIFRRHQQD